MGEIEGCRFIAESWRGKCTEAGSEK